MTRSARARTCHSHPQQRLCITPPALRPPLRRLGRPRQNDVIYRQVSIVTTPECSEFCEQVEFFAACGIAAHARCHRNGRTSASLVMTLRHFAALLLWALANPSGCQATPAPTPDCGAGYELNVTTRGTGAVLTSCDACAEGYYRSSDMSVCEPCPKGPLLLATNTHPASLAASLSSSAHARKRVEEYLSRETCAPRL
jgi:hypothetical protein